MRMIDSAFESWDFILFDGKILDNIWSTNVAQNRVEVPLEKAEKGDFWQLSDLDIDISSYRDEFLWSKI